MEEDLTNMSITEENKSCGMVELMDLPEPVLLQIMGYFNHDFLRHVASRVSMEWKRLACAQMFWSQASLCYKSGDDHKNFVRDLLATPYVDQLTVNLYTDCEEHIKSTIQAALVSTQCRIRMLYLVVEDYGPEIMLFIQQHPELGELYLIDKATENDYSVGVAAAVGRLVPQLTTLSLSDSYLLHMPKTALLLTSPSIQHGENYKLKAVKSSLCSLDLRNVDDENCEIEIINQPQGLQHIHFMPFLFSEVPIHIEPSSTWATAAKHLSSLIHAHKDTLKSASIILPSKDVLTALGECKLEELCVGCDSDGSAFCAMLQTMGQTLRKLKVSVQRSLGVKGLARVLEKVCQHAPRLESLLLCGRAASLFPGFWPLKDLLVDSKRPATLREICLSGLGPVGSPQLLHLALLAKGHGRLSLRKLELKDCPCSLDRSDAKCRGGLAESFLRGAMPSLEYTASTTVILSNDDKPTTIACDCEPVCELERKRQEFLALEQLNDHLVKSFFGDIDPVEFFKNAPF